MEYILFSSVLLWDFSLLHALLFTLFCHFLLFLSCKLCLKDDAFVLFQNRAYLGNMLGYLKCYPNTFSQNDATVPHFDHAVGQHHKYPLSIRWYQNALHWSLFIIIFNLFELFETFTYIHNCLFSSNRGKYLNINFINICFNIYILYFLYWK